MSEGLNNIPSYITDKREGTEIAAVQPEIDNHDTTSIKKYIDDITDSKIDQSIPDRLYNYICVDEARRKNQEYQKESEEFTNSVIEGNSVKGILDEAEATANLSEFDFGDIDEYLTKLDTLSFLEAISYKKKVDAEIARWKSCASMLQAISELRLDDNTNKELMKINAMEKYNFMDSIDEFEAHYDSNLEKLNQISNKLVSIVDSHKGEMDSTRFLTDEMIHLMKAKIDKLDPNSLNYDYNRTRMETVINAFENRLDLTYLKNKFEIYTKTNKKNILKDFRENSDILNNGRRSKVINDLIKFFGEEVTYAMYEKLMDLFNDNTRAVYVMLGFIAKVMNTEKKTSKDIWAKVFALNLSDMYNGIFDIDSENTYSEKIRNAVMENAFKFITSERSTAALDFDITFGLKKSNKEKLDHFDIRDLNYESAN